MRDQENGSDGARQDQAPTPWWAGGGDPWASPGRTDGRPVQQPAAGQPHGAVRAPQPAPTAPAPSPDGAAPLWGQDGATSPQPAVAAAGVGSWGSPAGHGGGGGGGQDLHGGGDGGTGGPGSPLWSPVPQAPQPRTGRRNLLLTAAGAAVVAALVGGGVGAGTYAALDDGSAPASVVRDTRQISQTSDTVSGGDVESAASTIEPSTVTIAVSGPSGAGTGSGVVLRSDGYILTNNHVAGESADGGTMDVTFSDGSTVPATLVGADPSSDLAVIKVDRNDLTAAAFGSSDDLKVGQQVVAVGSPLGLSGTVTTGIVSSLDRPVRTGGEGSDTTTVIDAVQTDAAINPGNSGGPLVDLQGRVVGINSAIASVGGTAAGVQSGNIGVGFAIPSDHAADVADQLISGGTAQHANIGVSVSDPDPTTGSTATGAVVRTVTAGGPAASGGLQEGDVITKIGKRATPDVDSLIAAVRENDPGDKVTVTYSRNGKQATVDVTLTAASGS